MSTDDRAPVLIGVGHVEQRCDDAAEAAGPLELMRRAVTAAHDDTTTGRVFESVSAVCTVRGIWRHENPAHAIAAHIGRPDAESWITPYGGNMVQYAVNQAAREILAGRQETVLLCGAEIGRTQARARKQGFKLQYEEAPGQADRVIGQDLEMVSALEKARGVGAPTQMYALFDNAIRAERGESLEAHRERISELWSRFSEVAAQNPNAWIRKAFSPEALRTPDAGNRMVSFPYTKLMNSNNNVDQGAALILTSAGRARALGVPADRIVYLHVGTDAADHAFVTERDQLHRSPAIRLAGGRALELAGLTPEEIEWVDLYSCFPSAVQVGARELGLSQERPLTVTGGLTFGGGPMNNYVMHSIARMAQVLRAHPGDRGLVTGNGGLLTKHSFGIYSTAPPAKPYRHENLQSQVDALPRRALVPESEAHGEITIEATTVVWGAAGPQRTLAAGLRSDGVRLWGHSAEPALLARFSESESAGLPAAIDSEGTLTLR